MARIDLVAEKRRIRLQIGRSRRRIDRRLRGLEREARRMVSWRTWARRVPLRSVAAALRVGAGAAGVRWVRRLRAAGLYWARRAGNRDLAAAIRGLTELWTHRAPGRKPSCPIPPGGDSHGGT